jgi:hypothetical protein
MTVSTASGICHTVTAICRYRGRVGTGLSVLWVAYAYGNYKHNLLNWGRITAEFQLLSLHKNIIGVEIYNIIFLWCNNP